MTEYNPRTNTWRNMPSLHQARGLYSVCTLDNKIFVFASDDDTSCEMLDMSDDDPHWRYVAEKNRRFNNVDHAVVIEKKIYAVGCGGNVGFEMHEDEGILMEYFQIIILIFADGLHCAITYGQERVGIGEQIRLGVNTSIDVYDVDQGTLLTEYLFI